MSARREVSDAELIAAPDAEGDAFAMFYERHVDDVPRFFVRRTGYAPTAADLVSWLFKIAQRQLNRFVRSAQVSQRAWRRAGIERLELSPEDIDRVERIRMVDLQPVAEALRDAVGSLPVGQADALRLRVGEGLPYRSRVGEGGSVQTSGEVSSVHKRSIAIPRLDAFGALCRR